MLFRSDLFGSVDRGIPSFPRVGVGAGGSLSEWDGLIMVWPSRGHGLPVPSDHTDYPWFDYGGPFWIFPPIVCENGGRELARIQPKRTTTLTPFVVSKVSTGQPNSTTGAGTPCRIVEPPAEGIQEQIQIGENL